MKIPALETPATSPGWRRRGSPLGILLAAAAAGALFSASCSIERDYRTLSFFFDGVPDPNAPPEPAASDSHASSASSDPAAARRVERPRGSSHEPYLTRKCEGCHKFAKTAVERPAWLMGAPKLLGPVETLCARCHEPPQARYVHGPVAALRCDLCHAHHESRYPHLLKLENATATCLSCHSGETFVTEQAHEAFDQTDCTSCHDPHASDQPLLLKEGWEQDQAAEPPAPETDRESER